MAVILGVTMLMGPVAYAAERMAVSANDANIRSGPGPNQDVLWKVEKYYPIEVIETSGVWLRFKDYEGDSGWVHKSLLKREGRWIQVEHADGDKGWLHDSVVW
jgi:SH3-like domain-containing protein